MSSDSRALITWLMSKLRICKSIKGRAVEPRLVLDYHEMLAAITVQCAWRKFWARARMYELLSKDTFKCYDRNEPGTYYYYNRITAKISRTKPLILRHVDLVPSDEWQSRTDMAGRIRWFHPATGNKSKISPLDAAKRLQGSVRRWFTKDLKMDLADVAKACVLGVGGGAELGDRLFARRAFENTAHTHSANSIDRIKFQRSTVQNYKAHPHKLSSCFNYALMLHTLNHDYEAALPIYEKLSESAAQQPTVLYARALFKLGTRTVRVISPLSHA